MHTFTNHHYTIKYGHHPTYVSIYQTHITTSYRPHVLLPSSYRFSPCATYIPLVPTWRKALSMPKTFAGSRQLLTGHQRVHRSLNTPPCALTVLYCPYETYHTVEHSRLSPGGGGGGGHSQYILVGVCHSTSKKGGL